MTCSACGGPIENGTCKNCGKTYVMPTYVNPDQMPAPGYQTPGYQASGYQAPNPGGTPNRKMTNCRTCGAWVAKSAKRCPYCGAKVKRGSFFKFLLWVIVIAIIGGIAISLINRSAAIRKAEAAAVMRQLQQAETPKPSTPKPAETKAPAETEAPEEPEAPAEEEIPEETETPEETEVPEEPEEAPASGGITPEFKEMMDSYEAFMDEYIDFMETYESSDNALGMLTDYLQMVSELAAFEAKIDAIDDSELSAADYAYYIEVMSRVEQKLILTMD